MEFHEIEMVGKFWMQRLPTLISWTSADEGRLIYIEDTNSVYYGGDSNYGGWVDISSHFIDSGTAFDPVNGESFVNKTYIMKIVNGNIRLYY
jgi:hypothetical protein